MTKHPCHAISSKNKKAKITQQDGAWVLGRPCWEYPIDLENCWMGAWGTANMQATANARATKRYKFHQSFVNFKRKTSQHFKVTYHLIDTEHSPRFLHFSLALWLTSKLLLVLHARAWHFNCLTIASSRMNAYMSTQSLLMEGHPLMLTPRCGLTRTWTTL